MKVSNVVVAGVLATTLYGAATLPHLDLANKGYALEGGAQEGSAQATAGTSSNITGLIDGICEKQEVVYGRLSAAGAVESIFVVNELFSATPTMVRDYGAYSEVVNLTDETQLVLQGDNISGVIEGESLVYQGNLSSRDLPWNVAVSYELDGKTISAEELAGKSGRLRIVVDTSQNAAVGAGYFDNYLLQITATLPMDKAKEITSDSGTIALSGSNTTVAFSAMPGKTGSFSLEADVKDFEMEGIQIAAVPFSMVIEAPNSEALKSQFDELISGASKLSEGSKKLSSGAKELASGVGKLEGGVGKLKGGSKELSAGLSAYFAGITQASSGLSQVAAGSNTFAEKLSQLKGATAGIEQQLAGTAQDMQALAASIQASSLPAAEKAAILQKLSGMQGQFGSLDAYLKGVEGLSDAYAQINDPLQQTATGLSNAAAQASKLSEGSEKLDAGLADLAASTGSLTQGTNKLSAGAGELSQGTSRLSQETKGIPDKLQAEIDAMMAEYDKSNFKPTSFIDARNTGVNLVQFVMTTDAIAVPEPEKEKPEEKDESLLSRFFALFS